MEKHLEVIKKYVESKEVEDLSVCIKNLIENNGQEAGEGANAEVFRLNHEVFGQICIKRSKKMRMFKIIDEEKEFDTQEEIWERGVSAPRPIILIEDKISKDRYIAMKFVEGCTLGEVMEGKQELPDTYDHEKFWKKVESDFNLMHDKIGKYNKSIHHRDLHPYNLMIERATGNPVIIDFGSSGEDFGGGDIYREDIMLLNEEKGHYEFRKNYPLKNDLMQINSIKKDMFHKSLTIRSKSDIIPNK
jgi:serine/threonine-protein kinase RIO1